MFNWFTNLFTKQTDLTLPAIATGDDWDDECCSYCSEYWEDCKCDNEFYDEIDDWESSEEYDDAFNKNKEYD
jgi:hypothetical protein